MSESGKAADTYAHHSLRFPESVVIHREHAKVIHEAAQYYALIYGTQPPIASTDHTFALVVEMSSVLYISNSRRTCAWRNAGFMRDLVKIITDCPNTQLALWSNRSGDEMRQIIKNTVHSLTHIMGLPLHRVAFAWAGDQRTPVHKLLPHLSTSADKHKLLKDPHTVYKAMSSNATFDTSLFLLSSDEESTGLDPWPTGHTLQLGPAGVTDLINATEILTYLCTLMRHYQRCVLQEPSSLYSPLLPFPFGLGADIRPPECLPIPCHVSSAFL